MGSFYYGKRTVSSATATTAAAGYPASNVGLESIARPWRATGVTGEDVVLNFSAADPAAAVLLEDVNFESCAVLKSVDGSAFTSVGTLATYADKITGRRRGLLVIDDATVKAVKLTISAGAATDGLAYWRIGAGYVFSSAATMPRSAGLDMRVRGLFPQVRADLPNAQVAVATTGSDALGLSIPFKRMHSQDALELLRRARAGTVGLNLGLGDYPEFVLPVRHIEGQQEEAFPQYRISQFTVELREVT